LLQLQEQQVSAILFPEQIRTAFGQMTNVGYLGSRASTEDKVEVPFVEKYQLCKNAVYQC